jgi:hypothetical protein
MEQKVSFTTDIVQEHRMFLHDKLVVTQGHSANPRFFTFLDPPRQWSVFLLATLTRLGL